MKQKIGNFINLAIFLSVFGFFGGKALVNYFSSDFGSNAIQVSASITEVNEKIKLKKGREVLSYSLKFTYPNGDGYESGQLTMSGDVYNEIVKNNKFDLVFDKGNPSNYRSKWAYDQKWTIGRVLMASLFGLVVGFIAMVVIGGFLNRIFKFSPEEESKIESA